MTFVGSAALCSALCSCSSDKDEPITENNDVINFQLILNVGSLSDSRATISYDPGTEEENYIDLDNIRIYLYSATEKFYNIYPLKLSIELPILDKLDYGNGQYLLKGVIDKGLLPDNFIIAILANWPKEPTSNTNLGMLAMLNSDDFVYDYGWGSYPTYFEPGKDNPIPMYGANVVTYKEVSYGSYRLADLGEVYLHRAMAKIIVKDDHDGALLQDVKLTNCMNRGMCAPVGMYSQVNIVTDKYINIPQDQSSSSYKADAGSAGGYTYDNAFGVIQNLPFKKLDDGSYVVYVPEFRNNETTTSLGSKFSPGYYGNTSVRAQLLITDSSGVDHTLDFADYEDGIASSTLNIIRNHTYIFTVKVLDNKLTYTVRQVDPYYSGKITFE